MKLLLCLCAGTIFLSGCRPGSMAVLVAPEPTKPPKFQETFESELPYQVAYKRILERCYGWTPGRFGVHGRPFISHEVFSDLREAVICRALNEDYTATMVTWKIVITATDSGCRLDVSAVNGDHWRDVRELVTTCLSDVSTEQAK